MWSIESTLSIWMVGVEVVVVDFRGSGLLSPQSPRPRDDGVVSMAARVGYGRVAVSDSKFADAVRSELGLGSGGGKENSLDVLRRLAVGDSLFMDILRCSIDCQNLPYNSQEIECTLK